MAELPLYRSFDESQEKCILCTKDLDDPIEFGDKLTYGEITIHHYCAVSVSFFNFNAL